MPQFRIVFRTSTDFRLMERAADRPQKWEVNILRGSVQVKILARDVVEGVTDIPWHRGLEVQVDSPAPDLDSAVAVCTLNAEAIVTLLAAAGRAPATPLARIIHERATHAANG